MLVTFPYQLKYHCLYIQLKKKNKRLCCGGGVVWVFLYGEFPETPKEKTPAVSDFSVPNSFQCSQFSKSSLNKAGLFKKSGPKMPFLAHFSTALLQRIQ